ncbi:MAG: RnfABCDGE type electron transport complex subunit D [Rhodocyclaceae bacterium]|nr:RnfABCDGE type electron transport complex subunit D [Rhodocyclaceae bacterium]
MSHSPYLRDSRSVRQIMLHVLAALLPGIAAYVWQFGAGILLQLLLASLTAVAAEAAMLKLRGKPIGLYLGDLSAIVTAWLIALSLPPIGPWWMIVVATLCAIVVAKHLYGGLGQNPFNPAMVAFCVMIVAFPSLMSQWPAAGLDLSQQLDLILGGSRPLDAITAATPLDALRTGLRTGGADARVAEIVQGPAFGLIGGSGWEWVAAGFALGGIHLLWQRIISWHLPAAFLLTMALTALLLWGMHPERFASPLLHLASGGTLLAAFFIVTDPVSGATTPKGKLVFAGGAAFIAYMIRSFGNYPDGIAFAVLLMNICVPLIDMYTQPAVFGHKRRSS